MHVFNRFCAKRGEPSSIFEASRNIAIRYPRSINSASDARCSNVSHVLFKACIAFTIWTVLLVLIGPATLHAAYSKRYTTIANGAITYTGNTLGLSKASYSDSPGTRGSIGTFITTDTSQRDRNWPSGTTDNWYDNSSSAVLRLPAGSTILYAELIWGGSYNYGGSDVSGSLNNAVTFDTPAGTSSVSPSASTSTTLTGESYYVRSADVTSRVKGAGAGTYTVGGVPGTQERKENNANAAGWTLAVIYGNPALPARNMTIFVGGELTSSQQTTTSSVSGFCTPQKGTINARIMVSAIEGDSNLTGDQMQFGPSTGTLSAVSGPNNPLNNFFSSQINKDDGTLDTAGTFGTSNHTPGSNGSGRRQGWDITNVDVSSRMQNSQSIAFARGTTSGDRYVISSIGLQVDVGQPVFPTAAMTVDKPVTYLGDIVTYTTRLDNTAGSADALNVVFTNSPPPGMSFVAGSVTVNGISQPAASPVTGVSLGTIAAGSLVTVAYKNYVAAIPLPPATAEYNNNSTWTYQYESCPSFPLNNGSLSTAPNVISVVPRLEPTKSATPPGAVLPGGTVTYTISIPNTGTAATSGTTLADPIPAGTTYVAGTTTMNGTAIADTGGQMPFAAARFVNSPGEPAGQVNVGEAAVISFEVTINPEPPLIITNIATIDPDGAGPAPAIEVSITNPPVKADLAVAITDNRTETVAGEAISYQVTVTNNGPDNVISCNLSVPLPVTILNPVYSASAGTYNSQTVAWTGLTLNAGDSVILTIDGTVAPSATSSIAVTATVSPSPGVEDLTSGNNSATDTDTILLRADLAVTKTDGKVSVLPGETVTYTITATNNGPSRVESFTLIDTLPALFQGPLFSPSEGVYNEETGLWTGLALMPGNSIILTLTGTVDVSLVGDLVNTVVISPPDEVTDTVPGNNTAVDTDTTSPRMSLAKSVDKASAAPGETLTYAVNYRNIGGSAAHNLIIMDTIPPNTNYVAGSLQRGTADSNYGDPANTTFTDSNGDSDGGSISGETIIFIINSINPDDEGKVFFKVLIN